MAWRISPRGRFAGLSVFTRLRAPTVGLCERSLRNNASQRDNRRHHEVHESTGRFCADRPIAQHCEVRSFRWVIHRRRSLAARQEQGGQRTIVLSGADKRIEILRGGVLIGQAPAVLSDSEAALPEALCLKLLPTKGNASPDWSAVLIAGPEGASAAVPTAFEASIAASDWQ
jgi:hypothetical protein